MGKIARHLIIQKLIAYTQSFEQFGKDDATHAVDAVDTNSEMSLANHFRINQFKVEH